MKNLVIKGHITKTPNDDDLQLVEQKLQFLLPPSYKNFVKQYGEGLLCGLFLIYVPNSEDENIDLFKKYAFEKNIIKEHIESGYWNNFIESQELSKQWFLSLEPFGSSENGDILCWDTAKRDQSGEYPIYLLDNEQSTAPLVAHSMDEFVEGFCINQKIDEIYPIGHGQKWDLPNTFEVFEHPNPPASAPINIENEVDNPYKYPSMNLFLQGKMVECIPHSEEGALYVKLDEDKTNEELIKQLKEVAKESVGSDRVIFIK